LSKQVRYVCACKKIEAGKIVRLLTIADELEKLGL
jgi:hypothetical protein